MRPDALAVRGKIFAIAARADHRLTRLGLRHLDLDALGGGVCLSTAVAVVPSQVCVAPIADLLGLMTRMPIVAMRVMEQTSRELALSLAIAGEYTAEQRLAAFLQAGLLLPAQDEALTVRATRSALAKLDVDASRLLN